MHYRYLYLLPMVALFSTLQAFSPVEDIPEQELNPETIVELVDSNDPSILRVEDEKIFIRSDKISPTDRGLFLKASGKNIRLPQVQSSQNGCYISYSQVVATVYPTMNCRKCSLLFSPTIFNLGKCPHCGHQN